MSDLAAFLRARLDEDEQQATYRLKEPTQYAAFEADPARVLRDVEAKRVILDRYERWDEGYGFQSALEIAVSVLAAVYSDHPDYRPEWARE